MQNESGWAGKHALITGASAGLGNAIARACAAAGMRVTLVARNAARLESAAAALGDDASALSADLTQQGEASRVVQEAHAAAPLDLVCHAAGNSMRGRIAETTREQFEQMMSINFLAAAELASAAAPLLAPRRGSLMLIGSLASHTAPGLLGAYPASKHALAALAQQYRLEWDSEGLHTLLVCPGPLARDDAGRRYSEQSADLSDSASLPGGGAKVRAIDPDWLSGRVLQACTQRRAELVVPLDFARLPPAELAVPVPRPVGKADAGEHRREYSQRLHHSPALNLGNVTSPIAEVVELVAAIFIATPASSPATSQTQTGKFLMVRADSRRPWNPEG